jgi:hypothetical protein
LKASIDLGAGDATEVSNSVVELRDRATYVVEEILIFCTCLWIADPASRSVILSSQKKSHEKRRFPSYFLSCHHNLKEEENSTAFNPQKV